MHVHLVGGEVNARFDLVTLELVAGWVPAELKQEVLAWLCQHQAELIEDWKKWQP